MLNPEYAANSFFAKASNFSFDGVRKSFEQDKYSGAPIYGSEWTSGSNCLQRVMRGGS